MDYAKILNVINSAITSSFLSEEKRSSLSKQLNRIKKRISDKKIYLGIVGEFSTGKSTLINSLIGEDFFVTNAIQGTTTTITKLEYGKKIGLKIEFTSGKLSKKYNVPMYIWTFDIWPDVVYSYGVPKCWLTDVILSWVIKSVYNSCNKIFVSSKRFKETIGRYTSKPMLYAPNWLRRVCDEKSDLHLVADKFQFTFAGNISRYQNLINTVRGFAKANIPDTILNIIGDGSYADNVRKVVGELKLENVIMYGRKPFNQIHDLLTQSDVLVLPLMANSGIEKTEPFKIQSYLRAGKPIFGILNGSGKDIIEENNIGICSKPDNVADIARGFREVMSFAKEHSDDVKKTLMN